MTKLGKNITFPIKNADGTSFHDLVLHKSTLDSVVMSLSDKITGDVYYKNNALAVTMNEYIEVYKNPDDANETPTKFVLVNPPTIVREGMASENSQLKGMTKYSFTFYHPMYMLGNLPFADVAVSDDQKQYLSESKTFNWIGNAQDYVAKLNKNLQVTPFIVRISDTLYDEHGDPTEKITVLSDVLSFDNVMVADALKTFYDTYGIPFVVDLLPSTDSDYASGKRYLILMGLPSETIVDGQGQEFVFRFGQGVGLKNNSRTPRNNKIVTRVAGYGSEENIPYGYPQIRWYGPSDWTNTKNDESDPTAYPIYEGIVGGALVKLIKHPFTRTHLMPTIYETTVFNKVSPYVEGGNANPDYDPDTTLVDYYDATEAKGYPHPINPNAPSYESHEFEDIKPQLGSETGITSAVPQKWDGTTYVDDDHWDDTMNDDGEYIQSYFKIGLPILPFDLYACAAITQQMNVVMRSGACLGCTFPVIVDWDDYKANFFNANGVFDPVPHTTEGDGHVRDINKYPDSSQTAIDLLVKKENTTFGVLMPNVYQHPSSDDKIVFTGISLPQSYITMAQALLDAAMDDWMMENNVYYWDYPLKFDEDFLSKNTDILAQIRPNVRVKFMFANDELVLYVKQLSIKYGDKVLPQYDITLTDNIEATRNAIGQTQADLKGVHTGLDRIGQAVQEITRKDRIKPTGSPTLPVYFNGNNEPKEIEGLEVPNDVIAHRNILAYGGVAAKGIPNLGTGAGGGQGDVTSIQFDSTIPYQTTNPYTAVDGLLRLPIYPSLAGMASQEWVAANFAGIGYESRVDAIEALIPSQATSLNQLADKAFVNSSIATATATYQGSYNLVSDLSLTTSATREQIASALAGSIVGEDNNDYAFVEIPTSDSTPTQIASVERYKFNGTAWVYEYTLNNSGMTAAQWAALNSGITASGVALIYSAIQGVKVNGTLLTPDSNQIVNVGVPTALSQLSDDASHRLVTDTQITAWGAKYDLPSGGIPKTDLANAVQTSLGLADTALQTVRTLTIQKNGTTIDTFDPTASANKTINISDVASASTLNSHINNTSNPHSVTKAQVGLGKVENTALSTWAGSGYITTLGTIATGVWHGSAIADDYIASAATWNAKQNALAFDGTYDASTNKVATKSTVTNAINALDVSNISGFGAGKTLASLTETDGKIAATFQNISITKSQVSDFPTTWALSNVTGADDLKAIEALTGTSGFLKKTAANTWALDTDVASGTALTGVSTRVGTLEGYFTNGVANNAARLSNTTKIGDTNQPVYFTANGVPAAISYTIGRNVAANEDVAPYTPATNGNISVNNHTIGISMTVTPDPTSSGTDISFIASVSQDSYGKISATKKAVRAASALQSGIVDTLPQTFAGDKTFNGNVQSMKGIAAHGIANLAINAGGGSGDVTSIKFGNGSLISASDGLLAVPVGQGTSNGQINIGGQDVSVKGLGTFAYISSLAFADLTNKPTTLSGYGITDAVTSVAGRNGDVTATHIADALTTAGYKLTDTDTKVTSAANHYTPESVAYTPTAGSWSWNSTTVVTGITKDDKGHIVGITTTKIANPNTDHYAWADITDKPATATRWPSWSEVTDKPGTFYTLPIASASELGGIKVGANLSINSSTGVLSATDTTYTNGTGLSLSDTTFSISQANVSTILNLLSEGASPATRDDYIIAQYAGGGTTTTSYHRRKLSNVFAALNSSDVTTALGYTPFNSANFTKADIKSTLGISDWALASTKPSYAFSEITGSVANDQLANSYIGIGNRQINLGSVLELSVLADDLALGSAASYAATNAVTKNSGALVTSGAVWSAIDALPEPMVFRGSLGTGGTITALPEDGTAKIGDTYKVITAGTYASKAAKVGDTFICLTKTASANTWELIPSGDEPSGTVTSVAMSVPEGLSVSGSPITSSGTFAITYASGYAIPTTAKQSNWDTAYGWGNHASAGYVKTVKVGNDSYSPTNGVVSLPAYPYAVSELVNDLGFTANTGTVTSVTIKGSGAIVVDYETAITGIGTRTISHATSGATAGSYGDSAAQTPAYGGTFKVPYVTVDAQGHVTAISEHTVKIPASDNTWRPLGTGANDACAGNDSRLSDARTPVAHASSATTYGVGTTSLYGHVKLATGDMNGAAGSDGVAVGKNHTHSQYALAANLGTASTHAHGDYVTAITYDSTNRKLQQSKGGGAATDIVQFGTNAFNSTAYLPLAGGTMANTNLVTNLNAEYLGGTKKADLFSAFTNDSDQLSSTIGGTNKKVTVGYASRSTDTKTELLTGQEFVYRQTAGGGLTYKPSAAVLKRVLGKTLVWNQYEDYTQIETYSSEGLTITNNNDGSFSVDGTATGSIYSLRPVSANIRLPKGHKILVKGTPIGASSALSLGSLTTYSMMFQLTNGSGTEGLVPPSGRIFNLSHDSGIYALKIVSKEGTEVHAKFRPLFFDLTRMFGEGNEPSTVEEFEALYPNAYYEYNAGQLINNAAKGLETVGFNQWDEVWEVGNIDIETGYDTASTTNIRSKNYIPVFPDTDYYAYIGGANKTLRIWAYDINKNPIVRIKNTDYIANQIFKTPKNCYYIRFGTISYGTTYNHDICINRSDPNRNGTYEPYKKNVLPLFPLKCKAPNGDIVIITDAKSAGSVRDERVGKKFIRRVGSVDLGTLDFITAATLSSGKYRFTAQILDIKKPSAGYDIANVVCTKYIAVGSAETYSSIGGISVESAAPNVTIYDDAFATATAAAFKAAMNGVYANYELATPIEYEIIDEAPYEYPIDVLGTERIVSDELVAPFIADIQYGAEQRNVAYDINSLHSNALALKGRASVLEGYFTDGIANNAARLSNTSAIGSTTKPVYFTADGVPSACYDYAGGTAVTLNGASKAANTASFYAPTDAGTNGQILKSTAGTPEWINQSAIVAGKATQLETSRSIWGQSFNGSANISGAMSGVTTINGVVSFTNKGSSNPVLNIDTVYAGTGIDYISMYVTATHRPLVLQMNAGKVGIGVAQPSYKLHVAGDIYADGGWLRTSGSAGWLSETYGGGWYCDDYTYVKTYGNRSIYTAADILAGGNIVGTKGVASQGIANLSVAALSGSNFVTQVKIGSTAYNPSDGVVSLPAYPTVPTALSGFTNDVGYITNVTGNQVTNALGYVPAKKQASTETVTGNTYDAGNKAEVYDVWTPTGTTATFKLPYDPALDIVNYVLVVNNLSSDITVSFVPQVGTAHIIAPNNSLVVPAGKAIEVSYLTQLIGSVETVVLSWSSAFSQYTIQ